MTHQFVAIPALIMNIIMKLIFGIYMKISYYFDILLNIGRSNMKQKAKNPVQSMLSYPFTFVGIIAHTFIFVCYHLFWVLPSFHLHSVLLCYHSIIPQSFRARPLLSRIQMSIDQSIFI